VQLGLRQVILSPKFGRVQSALDRLAAGLSALCVVHCLVGVAAIAALAPLAPMLGHRVHLIGFAVAMPLAALALARGYRGHGRRGPLALGAAGLTLMALGLALGHADPAEFALTASGAGALATAHVLNLRWASRAH